MRNSAKFKTSLLNPSAAKKDLKNSVCVHMPEIEEEKKLFMG